LVWGLRPREKKMLRGTNAGGAKSLSESKRGSEEKKWPTGIVGVGSKKRKN